MYTCNIKVKKSMDFLVGVEKTRGALWGLSFEITGQTNKIVDFNILIFDSKKGQNNQIIDKYVPNNSNLHTRI